MQTSLIWTAASVGRPCYQTRVAGRGPCRLRRVEEEKKRETPTHTTSTVRRGNSAPRRHVAMSRDAHTVCSMDTGQKASHSYEEGQPKNVHIWSHCFGGPPRCGKSEPLKCMCRRGPDKTNRQGHSPFQGWPTQCPLADTPVSFRHAASIAMDMLHDQPWTDSVRTRPASGIGLAWWILIRWVSVCGVFALSVAKQPTASSLHGICWRRAP